MKFEQLNINKKLKEKIKEKDFNDLTSIQEKCIPEIIQGKDVVGQAETGSGKTIAFCLPILEKIYPKNGLQCLILTPTRELCLQVTDVFSIFGKPLGVQTTSVYGGVSIRTQIKQIPYSEIVVGTPGRILDHLGRNTISFRDCHFLVLDEIDKMFEMGFIDDVVKIIRHVPKKRQTLMFSATISDGIDTIMRKHLNNPVIIKTNSYVDKSKLRQIYYDIYQPNSKFSILVHLLKNNTPGLAIVFCGTRQESDVVARNLRKQGIHASAIHGGMSQHKRTQSLDALKNNHTNVLVATDVAARGLDIKNVSHIYNYDVPKTSIEYVHRIGRTARAGANGSAVTLLTERDHDNFRRVQSDSELIIERAQIPDFKKVPFLRQTNRGEKSFSTNHYHNHNHRFRR